MAWHSIFLNFFFTALVVVAICGSLVWAIATQHRDWPRRDQGTGPYGNAKDEDDRQPRLDLRMLIR